MNKKEIVSFISKFQISENKIEKILKGKKIIKKNQNIFLLDEDFKKNEIYSDYMLFINLKNKLLPTTFLLNWIKENSKLILFPKTQKNALDFTYSKNLGIDQIANKENIKEGYYILSYDKAVLGYIQKKNKILINRMNIGEYLRE